MAEEKLVYRPEGVLQRWDIGRTKLYSLLASGELPSFKVGRARFITHADLLEFFERSKISA
jgi:excisionase family DNA binding protein